MSLLAGETLCDCNRINLRPGGASPASETNRIVESFVVGSHQFERVSEEQDVEMVHALYLWKVGGNSAAP